MKASLFWRAVLGAGLGFGLSFIGFGSYDEVHHMFLLEDPRLLLTFACGVILTGIGFAFMRRSRPLPRSSFRTRMLPGAALFGAGWAICGACPGITLVQLGEGKLLAAITLAGLVLGNWGYGFVTAQLAGRDLAQRQPQAQPPSGLIS